MEGCFGATRLTGPAVDEVSGGGQSLDPEGAGHAGVEQKGANAIIQSPNDSFSFAILGGSVWT